MQRATPTIPALAFTLAALAILPAAARGQEPDPAAGQALFKGEGACFSCHRADGKGTPLAPDLTDDAWLHFDARPTREQVEALIRTGVPRPVRHPAPMPAMGGATLTDTEIADLAAYVLSLSAPDKAAPGA